MIDRYDYLKELKSQINYSSLCRQYTPEDVDGVLELIVDTLSSTRQTVRIGGETIPISQVQNRLLSLEQSHLEYVFDCLHRNSTKIRNIRAYLLTALYNAPLTIIQAYRVVVQGGNRDAPLGTVRKLNYPEQVKRVMANALHAEKIEFTYPSGEMHEVAIEKYMREREWLFHEYGMPSRTRYCPYDENKLQGVLAAEQLCQQKRQAKARKKPPKGPLRE